MIVCVILWLIIVFKVNGVLVKTHRQESLIHSVFIIN